MPIASALLMCGIAGAIWNDPKRALERRDLQRMTDVLRHRGPDDEGAYQSEYLLRPPYDAVPGVALGARRLAIIDVDGGHQPISNEDGTICVVLNGEIYNYRELRHRLEGAGHTFRTDCDTETLVHLYEDEGKDFVQHLVGMFALAIWDQRNRCLLLARDRLGQKPLVYRSEPNRLLFASEIKSLLQVPDVPRTIDPNAVDEYLTYQYVPYPNTIFEGIRKLPPAHLAVYCDDRLEIERYWAPQWNNDVCRPVSDYEHELRERLTQSVDLRLRSDVPLGAFLSGGIDSSLIVSLMQSLSTQPVKTFSIGFSQPAYDETRFAREVANHVGTEHHEFYVEPDLADILPKLAWHFDEPFADSSAIPTWYVAQQAREHVKVALTGDGGDELFAGYARYQAVHWGAVLDRLPKMLRSAAASSVWQKIPGARRKSVMRRLKRFAEPLRLSPPRRYLEWIAIFNEQMRSSLYQDDFLTQLPNSDPSEFLERAWRHAARRDPVTTASLTDMQTYLPCDLMHKVDTASMAHGLECRQPLLDHRVVELAIAMPRRWKYRRGRGKWILRKMFGNSLPAAVFRRQKMGFGVPLDYWFRAELKEFVRDVLLDPRTLSRGYFQAEAVERLVREHQQERRDHSDRLWCLLFFELWQREWIDPAVPM